MEGAALQHISEARAPPSKQAWLRWLRLGEGLTGAWAISSVDRLQRPRLPSGDLVQHGVRDRADQVRRDLDALEFLEVASDHPRVGGGEKAREPGASC